MNKHNKKQLSKLNIILQPFKVVQPHCLTYMSALEEKLVFGMHAVGLMHKALELLSWTTKY